MEHDDDITDLAEKAKIVAAATGRDEADVLADLLDDGVVNMSNRTGAEKDLVTQLKEAAELINTVQNINKEVSENSVLNGGENKTEVKVETTLEGDIVDRAIESVQRKADNIKKLLVTLTPLLLLITGGSLDAMGLIDITGSDDVGPDSEYEVWGCTDWDADNYNPDATHDDDSCFWDEPEDCGLIEQIEEPILRFRPGSENDLQVVWNLQHDGDPDCDVEIEFMIALYLDNAWHAVIDYDELPPADIRSTRTEVILGHPTLDNLGEGNWSVEARWKYMDGEEAGCCTQTQTMTVEPETIAGCTDPSADNYNPNATHDNGSCTYPPEHGCTDPSADNYNPNATHDNGSCTYPPEPCEIMIHDLDAYLDESDAEGDAIKVEYYLHVENDCPAVVTITYTLEKGDFDYTFTTTTASSNGDRSQIFDVLSAGNWTISVDINDGETLLADDWIEDISVPPQQCEITLYDINFAQNNDTATIGYDLDCGLIANNAPGKNVMVRFLAFENETQTMLKMTNATHFIEGWASDYRTLTLEGFVDPDITNYDFVWLAIWEDDSGNPRFIERVWHDIEIVVGPDCSNSSGFDITSLSATFVQNGSNAIDLIWVLDHNGPSGCLDSMQIEINLYADGNFSGSMSFSELGTWYVDGGRTTLRITAVDATILGNLSTDTEYDALLKFWETGAGSPDADVFTNKIKIS